MEMLSLTKDSRNDRQLQYPCELVQRNCPSAYFADTDSDYELNDDDCPVPNDSKSKQKTCDLSRYCIASHSFHTTTYAAGRNELV